MAKKYICTICGYVHTGDKAPETCPQCQQKDCFKEMEGDKPAKKGLDTNSNIYTILYASIMVIIVALLLAVVSAVLKPRQDANVKLDTQKQILASLNLRDLDNAAAEKFYAENIKEVTCDKCQLSWFEANLNGEKKYILPVRGAGLWGPIWGYIAVNDDKQTIFSVFFNHDSETPGLGGEIKNYSVFQQQFEGKPVLGTSGKGILIEKAGNGGDVDCISGATITSKGVESMLISGLAPYVEAGWFDQLEPALDMKTVINENEVENRECDEK